jgi:hypothetical protein
MLLEILMALLFITGIILLILGKTVMGICLITGSIFIISYLLYKYFDNENSLSMKILDLTSSSETPQTKSMFNKLCDKLFKKQGDQTYRQYIDMKQKRSPYESENLCKNLAKVKAKKS